MLMTIKTAIDQQYPLTLQLGGTVYFIMYFELAQAELICSKECSNGNQHIHIGLTNTILKKLYHQLAG